MALQPLDDRVVVQLEEAEEKTVGGIVLPDTAKEKPQRGEIIAIGNGKMLASGERVQLLLKVGDRVVFRTYSGTEVKVDGKEYKILKESDILARLG